MVYEWWTLSINLRLSGFHHNLLGERDISLDAGGGTPHQRHKGGGVWCGHAGTAPTAFISTTWDRGADINTRCSHFGLENGGAICAVRTTVFASKGELRRLVQGGGLSINKVRVDNPDEVIYEKNLLNGKYLLIQKGKKNYPLIRII